MRGVQAFKKRYLLVPAALLVCFIGWIIYFMVFPVGQTLYQTVKLNNLVTLHVTQADAGATTAFSYRYYLYDAKKSDAEFMKHIDDETPFMITSDDRATATVKDDQLYLRVRGDIYSFSNISYSIRIHLDAAP
ncbi:hypothetical protein O0466_000441 [Salmonella enterica]|nr:hypothetical protein [Salmonella enterica]HCM1893428.1 hypothetical protein [Salmonella enterica subsp. diarizonae serovar 57:c:e,n,x,z15]EAX3524705.1 hypothetical protein [Salmonella enterica]EAY1317959.1 hypothetical protein [Salmonella enterica]EGQ5164900.1 DUF5412 domain-containing protein [Salmonella enterica]